MTTLEHLPTPCSCEKKPGCEVCRGTGNAEDAAGYTFKHYNGDDYVCEGVAIQSNTGATQIIYRRLGTLNLFVHNVSDFLLEVDGKPRFKRVN